MLISRKKVIAPNWPTFLRGICRSPAQKKKSSSQHFQTAARGKFSHILHYYGQFGGARWAVWGSEIFVWGAPPPWSPLVGALRSWGRSL